jgi:hypothetical protein
MAGPQTLVVLAVKSAVNWALTEALSNRKNIHSRGSPDRLPRFEYFDGEMFSTGIFHDQSGLF